MSVMLCRYRKTPSRGISQQQPTICFKVTSNGSLAHQS
jgi:hypothetical protein